MLPLTKSERMVYEKVCEVNGTSATGVTQAFVASKLNRQVHTISGRFGKLVEKRYLRVAGKDKHGLNLYVRRTDPATTLELSLEALSGPPTSYYGGRDY